MGSIKTLVNYSLPVSVKQQFDLVVPSQKRSRLIATLMLRFLARGKAMAELKKEFNFKDSAELSTHPQAQLIYYHLEMRTQKKIKELNSISSSK